MDNIHSGCRMKTVACRKHSPRRAGVGAAIFLSSLLSVSTAYSCSPEWLFLGNETKREFAQTQTKEKLKGTQKGQTSTKAAKLPMCSLAKNADLSR